MDPTVVAQAVGFAAVLFLSAASLIASWQTRRLMIAVFGENPGRAQLGQRGYYVRPPDWPAEPGPSPAPAAPRSPAVEPTPGSSRLGAPGASLEPAPGSSGAMEPTPRASRPGREPFKPPSLAPLPEARGPAPAAPSPRRAAHLPPIPREEPEQPETLPEPAVRRPADLAELGRDLDAADQAQADQAPELQRVPTTRPPPTSQQAPAASGAQVSGAPPASGSAQRPLVARETRSERPPPHAPPKPIRSLRPSLLSPLGAAVAPPSESDGAVARRLSRAIGNNADGERTHLKLDPLPALDELPKPSAGDEFDDAEEVTRVADNLSPDVRSLAPGAQGPRPHRTIHATLASMPSLVPPSARPAPSVDVVNAADNGGREERPDHGRR